MLKLLYIQPYTVTAGDHADSGVVGYGLTSGTALVDALRSAGHQVDLCPAETAATKLDHIVRTYHELTQRTVGRYDAIVMFNTHHQSSAEIRRMLFDLPGPRPMLVGYTHGSHWDPTDRIRHDFPELRFADLGNIMAMDRVLLVSEYIRDTIAGTITSQLGVATAAQFLANARVVGLPIATGWMDRARQNPSAELSVVFNHSATPAKRPELFFALASGFMTDFPDARLTVTRRFTPADAGWAELERLRHAHPYRVTLGHTMSADDYFRALWRSHLQVSTASHESLGVSTLEAMYCGCCCILPDVGSYREITGGTGVHPETDIADHLHAMAADPAAREDVAKRQRLASEYYAPERIADRVVAAIAR